MIPWHPSTTLIALHSLAILQISFTRVDEIYENVCDEHKKQFEFVQADLRNFSECKEVVKDIDIVFQVAGVKGST